MGSDYENQASSLKFSWFLKKKKKKTLVQKHDGEHSEWISSIHWLTSEYIF